MSWQRCPICDGTGVTTESYTGSTITMCKVCDGHMIISTLTGKPPIFTCSTPTIETPNVDIIYTGESQIPESGS